MVCNMIGTKPLGLVLIVVAHMALSVHSQVEVTGIVGNNITLQFTFNVSLINVSLFGVYKKDLTKNNRPLKIDQFGKGTGKRAFDIYHTNSTVFWHITNLKLNDSQSYWLSMFDHTDFPKQSNVVQLIVREENRSSTVPTTQSVIPTPEADGSSSPVVTVLVVLPVALLAAVLPCLIWSLVRSKDKPQSPQQSSTPTVQETVEVSRDVPAAPVIYSVLDFPKRPSAVLEINPSDTEYAAVSYPPEKRQG